MSVTDIMYADDIEYISKPQWTKWEKEPLLDEKGPSSIQTTMELFQTEFKVGETFERWGGVHDWVFPSA